MAIIEILAEIESEIAPLEEVKRLLLTTSDFSVDGVVTSRRSGATKTARPKKRTLSAEARKKIADAQRKRWAAQKAKK